MSLEAIAKRTARPKAALIRDAVARFVAANRRQSPSSVGIFDDTEVDSTNVDEWLRENWRPE